MAYATKADLEARWRKLTDEEAAIAETLLEDAATTIRAEGFNGNATDKDTAELLKMLSCKMVKRAMPQSDAPAITQGSMTVGPFSESFTYANPHGEIYLTNKEKSLLGIGAGRIGSLEPVCKWGEA